MTTRVKSPHVPRKVPRWNSTADRDPAISRVLLVQDSIPPYRVPIFSAIADLPDIELTVAHAVDKGFDEPTSFARLPYVVKRGKFVDRTDIRSRFKKGEFDVVIAMFNLRCIDIPVFALNRRRRFGLILWGIGVSCSHGYATRSRFDILRTFVARRADVVMLYSGRATHLYLKAGIPTERLVVAENTVHVPDPYPAGSSGLQSAFLFLGALRRDKGIEELIEAYAMAKDRFSRNIDLEIIGDGPERVNLESLVDRKGLRSTVHFRGALHSLGEQRPHFARSIACISPSQAGLSVLLSMAHGVPFVTRCDAITGGERFNIRHDDNGVEYSGGPAELAEHLIMLANDSERTIRLGLNALRHYEQRATSTQMVDAFRRAILQARSSNTSRSTTHPRART